MNPESISKAESHVRSSILIVEDDIEIRHVLATRLREVGFTVSEASNAAEALRLIRAGIDFDAVITDVEMPGDMNGIVLAERIRADRPDIQIVIVSGTNVAHDV